MPVIPAIVSIATAGAGIYSSVKNSQTQSKAVKANQSEIDRQTRITQVQEIKQNTLNTIQDVNAPEWTEFYNYSISNAENVDGINAASQKAIKAYQERTKKNVTVPTNNGETSNTTGAFNGGVGSLDMPMISALLQSITQSAAQQPGQQAPLISYIPSPSPDLSNNSNMINQLMPIILIVVAVIAIKMLKRRR